MDAGTGYSGSWIVARAHRTKLLEREGKNGKDDNAVELRVSRKMAHEPQSAS
jgi:hypothetical protein